MANDPHSPTTATQPAKPRSAVADALLIVVFLVLIFIGIAIAIYSSRYVPVAINTFSSGTNAVTGLPNNPNSQGQLAVVPGSSIPFNVPQPASTSTTMFPSSIQGPYGATQIQNAPAPAPATAAAYSSTRQPYGLSDLSVNIIAVGYLANSSNSSFVATPVVPVGARAAVEFSIGNTGTNATGPWAFAARIPTDNGYTFNSPVEPSLNPGDHTVFTLGFDQVPPGPAEQISIIADPSNYIQEITKTNNVANASVAVVGS